MVFHDVSRECLNWMEKQLNVKEESLTDWLLYEVSKQTNFVIMLLREMRRRQSVLIGNGGF